MAEVETEKLRWAILAHLKQSAGYELSDELLLAGSRAQGIPTTADKVLAAIAWLKEQELVTTRELLAGVLVARVTPMGAEVAEGFRVHPGVLRPGPGLR